MQLTLLFASFEFVITGGDDKFIIDSSTGEIRTTSSPLDREEKSVYQLIAVAKDRGNNQVCFLFSSLYIR